MNEDENREDEHLRMEALVRTRLSVVQSVYSQALTTLWAANGSAALALLTYAASHGPSTLSGGLIFALFCFVIGLVAMAIGIIGWLWTARLEIRAIESVNSLLDIPAGRAKRPSERAGLTLQDWRTSTSLAAAALFALGVLVGILSLISN